jgi:hypothetical protein
VRCAERSSDERSARAPLRLGATEEEHEFFRAIDVDAPAPLTYRWVQQLRIAPYSYDWADNFLLPSPARRTPRADRIKVGQRMMHVFSIVALERGRTLTLGARSRAATALFGTFHGSYVVTPRASGGSRLFVKVNAKYPHSLHGRRVGGIMPWIDLVMMRRQLRRLKVYAERSPY